MEIKCLTIYTFLIYFVSCGQCLTLVAKLSLKGITGRVTFTQNGADTTVNFNLAGLQNSNSWHIRSLRMIYDRQSRCTDAVLGKNYISSTGTVTTSGQLTETIASNVLPNLAYLTGRSLLLIDTTTSTTVCATIEADEDHITGFAKLQFVVGGTIYFRQAASSSNSATAIYTNVFHLKNTALASNENVTWAIHSGTVTNGAVSCSNIGYLYNPSSSPGTSCGPANQENCPVGDLSNKNSDLPVGGTSEASLTSLVDNNLPLSGSISIIGKLLVLKATDGTVLTCSKIIKYQTRNAVTTFSRDNVTGTISFQQMSPFDTTSVAVNIIGLDSNAGGYHIHKWPVPEKWSVSQMICDNNYVSGHFNPFSIDVNTDPSPGVGTTDQYEIGDISGKFGMLNDLSELINNYTDYNLPLFGINSVIGRSIVVHYDNTARWVCSNIEYVGSTVTGVATFVYPVIGYIVFKQPTDIESDQADTMIYTALNYGERNTPSVDHKWHVHVDVIDNDHLNASSRCVSVQGHYNPYSVDLDGNYGSQCNTNNPLRCEVGDLSGKHGKLSVRDVSGKMKRNFFTDIDLPLTGNLKITGRSIVIHAANAGGARFSCANIYTIPNRKVIVKTGTWSKESASNADGSFTLQRSTAGLIAGTTDVSIQLSNLESAAGGYHVHLYPVPQDSSTPCSPTSVGGHFNPFGIDPTAGPIDGSGSDDKYEIGDLSRKYGAFLDGKAAYSVVKKDTMLPLRGPLSITGRSIVIHKSSTGAPRWMCGNITEDPSTGGVLYEAKATFNTSTVIGSIYLTQYMYGDDGLSDTGILVDVKYRDGSTTTGHNWHVHKNPMEDDVNNGCLSPGGHYNPFKVDVDSGYDECTSTNQLRCELGDQSKKVGQYNIGGGRRFYTDVNLPLVGKYGVAGKAFVIHAANSGAGRIACANILPVNKVNPVSMNFAKDTQQSFQKSSMINTLASALHTSTSNLAVSGEQISGQCMSASVYLTGKDAATLRSKLVNMANGRASELGDYVETTTCCSCIPTISVLVLMFTLLLQRLSAPH